MINSNIMAYTKDKLVGGNGANLYPVTPWANVFDPGDESRTLSDEISELEGKMMNVEATAADVATKAVAPVVDAGRQQLNDQKREFDALVEHIDGSNLVTNIYEI